MQDIANKICLDGLAKEKRRNEEERSWSKFRDEGFSFRSGGIGDSWINDDAAGTRAEKRRKGGNKSVATNMSLARLFIGQKGQDVYLRPDLWLGHCFKGGDTVFSRTSRGLGSFFFPFFSFFLEIEPCNVLNESSTIS